MSKFYIKSGQLEKIVIADDIIEACTKAVLLTSGETLGLFFAVDERGFRSGFLYGSKDPNNIPEHLIPLNDIITTVGLDEEEGI